MHIKIFNDAQWAVAKEALSAAGHAEVESLKSNTAKFLDGLEKKFPDIYTHIQTLVADYKDKTMSGGDKAVAIAGEVLSLAPEVVTNLPGIKDALVAGVTQFYADEISDFGKVALDALHKL